MIEPVVPAIIAPVAPTTDGHFSPEYATIRYQEADMARRRLQKHGDLYEQGDFWKLRWREDQRTPEGGLRRGWSRSVTLGPSAGPGKLTKRQAERIAWENFLSRLDQNTATPQSVATVQEFIERKFMPGHVALLKPSGQAHYKYMLAHAAPTLGGMRLRDVTTDDVQQAVSGILQAGLSTQTARHVRNAVSAIFTHAERIGWHPGPNPARLVRLPEMIRRPAHALNAAQCRALLAALPCPEREMALAMILTGMGPAELCGLQWRHVNLSADWRILEDEAIPPSHLAIRQHWYRGRYGSLKAAARRRNIPIPEALAGVLSEMARGAQGGSHDAPVFAARNGKPLDEHNAMRRHVKPVAARLKMPWISWRVFRRTHTTLAQELGASFGDRMALMGHADPRMTAWYTLPDGERRREVLERMGVLLMGEPQGGVQ